jgi:hypothetical protein
MRISHLAGALALTLAAASAAQAQDPPATTDPAPAPTTPAATTTAGGGFGQVGQMVVTGALQFQLSHSSTSSVMGVGGGSSNTVIITPSLDYFVAPNISVGGTLGIAHEAEGGSGTGSVTTIGIGARGGYHLAINDMLSLWPQLQLAYNHLSIDPGVPGSSSLSGYTFDLSIFAPLLYHITQHLFFGIGPVFQTELISKVEGNDFPKQTDFGLASVLGGYWP